MGSLFSLIPSLISGGASLLGGLFGQQNQANINQQNVQAQEMMNAQNIANQQQMLGATLANQDQINASNLSEAERFAQNGLQWRVTDAKKAGISPLAALGFSSPQAPVAVGANLPAPSVGTAPQQQANNSFGTGISQFGQDVSRAIAQTRSADEQAVAIEKTRQDLEAGQLDNELKKAQLSSIVGRFRSAQVGPGMPKVADDVQLLRTPDGRLTTSPTKESEGTAWADPIGKEQYFFRNQLQPWFGYNVPSKLGAPDKGYSWYRGPLSGEWYQGHNWQYYWDTVKDLYGHSSGGGYTSTPGM